MYKTTLKIDGMMCGMCESHINDTIRKAVPVKKVSSSHTRGEAVVITDEPLDVEAVKAAVHKDSMKGLLGNLKLYLVYQGR